MLEPEKMSCIPAAVLLWLVSAPGAAEGPAPASGSAGLCCRRNGVSNHIATPGVSVASSLLQQGNNLHQTCFLARAAFPLCQLQCVGWHIAEMGGEGVETESRLPRLPFRPAVPGSRGTSACGKANQPRASRVSAGGWGPAGCPLLTPHKPWGCGAGGALGRSAARLVFGAVRARNGKALPLNCS